MTGGEPGVVGSGVGLGGSSFNQMGEELAGAQRRIEDQAQRLAATPESLGDALVVTEPHSTRIATVNPRVDELVPELKVGGTVDGPDSPLSALDAALGSEAIIEHRGRSLSVTAAMLGNADGVVWTVHDMSKRARLERAKSEFVATASHELRSPLISIKGFVELLGRTPENMSERQREFVEIILGSTDRLVWLDVIRGRRVLVVDDERDMAELIAGQLTPLEVSATIATMAKTPCRCCAPHTLMRSRSTSSCRDWTGSRSSGRFAPIPSCGRRRPCSSQSARAARSWPASGRCRSRSTPTSCATCSVPRFVPDAPACWSSAASSSSRCSSPRSTIWGSSTSGRSADRLPPGCVVSAASRWR